MKKMNLRVEGRLYKDVTVEDAKVVEMILAKYQYTEVKATKVETPKEQPKKTEYAKVYAVAKDGKSVTIGNDGFIPTKVFKGVTYSLKQSGAKYDSKTKSWTFGTKKACADWCKSQDARA